MHYTLRMQNAVGAFGIGFTAVDAAMTAGYMLLTIPSMLMAPIYAVFAAMGAIVLAYMLSIGAVAWSRGVHVVAVIVWLAYVPAFALNFTWNFGLTATMLETNIKEGRVRDTTTTDVRGEIERLEKRHADLTRQIEFAAHLGSPESYDAEEMRLKNATDNGRNIWQRTNQCQDTTLQVSQDVCQAIATARANRANADAARQAAEDRRAVSAALADAKARYAGADKTVSEAEAQARLITRVLTGSVKPDDATVDWTSIYLSLGASLFVSVMASLCILVRSLNLAGVIHRPEEHNSWAPRQAIAAAPEYAPVPLPSRPAPSRSSSSYHETFAMRVSGDPDDALRRLRGIIESCEQRAK